MPGGDRTGPRGEGAMTGRALGLCSGSDAPGYMIPGGGYGGRGMRGGMGGRMGGGGGRGYRHIYNATGLPRWMRGGGNRPFYPDAYPYAYPGDRADTAYAADNVEFLKQEADLLEKRLKSLLTRIKDLETDSGKDTAEE